MSAEHVNNSLSMETAAASLGAALLPSLLGLLARSGRLKMLWSFFVVAALVMTALLEAHFRRLLLRPTARHTCNNHYRRAA